MKKLLILALASAFVAAANADATINWGVTTSTLTNASWKDNNAPGVAGNVFKIDADVGDEVALLPSGTAPAPQVKTVVTVEATFTASSDVPEDLTGATTALTVAKENNVDYYFYWNGDSWEKITGVDPTLNEQVTVSIELDNSTVGKTTATIKVDGTEVAEVVKTTETTLGSLAFAGTGSLTSVAATVTPAYATTTTKKYASVYDALKENVAASAITVHAPVTAGTYETGVICNSSTGALLFPRTKTADQDGSANNPYEIADADDLIALKDAVANVDAARSKSYKQTADIELDAAWEGIGIKGGKDLVNHPAGTSQATIDADIATFIEKAFSGTYDGGNYTISKFQMENGTDYGGLFNSINGATIKNLKVSYKENKLCANSSSTGGDTGATFVGVARGSTLSNLTAKATESVTTVSASKDMGGIVAYLMAGSTVDSCMNELNVASLLTAKARKSGGIALITQDGTGTATIRNCKNNGTVTLAKEGGQLGGIVGYVGTNTTIIDCENTAAVKVLTVMDSAALTMQGTNKGNATVLSSNVATSGLNFATVDGNVATFVADNALAEGNTYKVMAAGATATYQFTAAGTIAFDTALATPTYAITAASGFALLEPSTSGTVKTYTAVQTFTITWKSDANTTIDTTTVNYNVMPTHADPTKAGCSFKGWDPAIVAATADATYTATWEQTAIPVEVETAKTLVSVPQSCKASELIDTSNREKDDMLQVLNKATQKYYQWSYDGEGGWTPNNVATVGDNVVETPEANTIDLVRGEAVWVTRKDASKEILLKAAYTDDPVTVSVIKGYNLVAPLPKAGVDTIAIDEVVADDSTSKDRVFIPAEGKAPYNLDFKDGKWGYDKYTVEGGKLKKARVTDVTIPAGTGFFYINNGDDTKNVTLGTGN